ncbi:MAG TPA: twin-arginine translocase TatA/TatE family subunit [Mycobacteriales bacterium]|nr:twin-arginine translocase TatA/TatE family subunit [Mycobacteriales bacterium]
MIGNLGLLELLVIAAAGLLLFGPDRLPRAVAEAVRVLRQVRQVARSAIQDVKSELGPELADLDVASLHPRRLAQAVFDDEPTMSAQPEKFVGREVI